jgi:hypothetical protein
MVYNELWLKGEFLERDEMFLSEDKVPYSQWIVYAWEPIK